MRQTRLETKSGRKDLVMDRDSSNKKEIGKVNWDLQYLIGLDSFESVEEFAVNLAQRLSALHREVSSSDFARPINESLAQTLVTLEECEEDYHNVYSYVYGLTADNLRKKEIVRGESFLEQVRQELRKAQVALRSALSELDEQQFELLIKDAQLSSTAHTLVRMRFSALHSMSETEETLAAELSENGGRGWGRLYDSIAAELSLEIEEGEGRKQKISAADIFSYLSDPDPQIRKQAYWANTRIREVHAESFAAALNGIAGERLNLWRRRGYADFFDVPLHTNDLSRDTLELLMSTVYQNRDLGQSFMKLKAQLLGFDKLALYDRTAPLPLKAARLRPLAEARDTILESLAAFHEPMSAFTEKAFAENWLETEPRESKGAPGFCLPFSRTRSSGINHVYNGSFLEMSGVAHEIGHGYHNFVMYKQRYWARQASSTLCETAALTAEALLRRNLIRKAGNNIEEEAFVLGIYLNSVVNFLSRIPRDFDFEKRFYDQRNQCRLSVENLNELMRQTYDDWFGDVLGGDSPDTDTVRGDGKDYLGWCTKPHFFFDGTVFYNFPYTLGFLLAEGIALQFSREGQAFQKPYDRFLEFTGRMSIEDAALHGLGIDLTKPDFYEDTYADLQQVLERFRILTSKIFDAGPKPV